MRNERGLTLVELLAVLAIIGIIMTLLTSVFINGIKASDRGMTNQKLQQEANYIMETIRKEYLELKGDVIELEISPNTLKMNEKVISEGYEYEFKVEEVEVVCDVAICIDRNKSHPIELIITKDNLFYTIDTTLSKLH